MKRIRAVPTVNAIGFGFILGAMWYVGIAQGNGVAYLLFFSLLGVLLVSVPKTYLNLAGIRVNAESPKPVFAGQEIKLPLELINESKRVRCAMALAMPGARETSEIVDEIPPSHGARTAISFPAIRRGIHEITTLTLSSIYPIGFLKAWRSVPISQQYLVYPEPVGDPRLPQPAGGRDSSARALQPEGDDFAGHRPYQLGEAQRHIDWKAAARGHPLMSKQFAREEGGEIELNFDFPNHLELEARLSQLTLWVLSAERARRPYSLVLPTMRIPAGTGEAHYHQCLSALACYPADLPRHA